MPAYEGGGRISAPSFDAETVRRSLPVFGADEWRVPDLAQQEYLAYYGIDFSYRVPGVVHHFGRHAVHGFELACHHYEVPGARGSCVIQHGYFDHVGLCARLIEHCLKRGYSVLTWDLPGHGLSSGEQASIHSFEDYTEVLAGMLEAFGTRLPGPCIAIGQSTGAAVLLGWVFRTRRTRANCPFARILLLAPLVRPARWGHVSLLYYLLRPFRAAVKREFVVNSGDQAFLDFVQADPLQSRVLPVRWVSAMRRWVAFCREQGVTDAPLEIIQGDADETVDWRWNLPLLRAHFPAAPVTLIPGARHHLINESAALREQVFAALAL